MIVGFGDVGSAWTGLDPYATENSFNTSIIQGHNYQITLQNQKEPIIYGYGFGLRSVLSNYFIRADWGFGIEEGLAVNSQFYLSLSLDF